MHLYIIIIFSIHDAKIMKTQINNNFKNKKKLINLIGDKYYIKGTYYRNKIYNENKQSSNIITNI